MATKKNKKNDAENKKVIDAQVTDAGTETTETTTIAVVTPTESITDLFSNIDMAALNAAVENIANRPDDKVMTDTEKTTAVSIIDEWERNVVQNIANESSRVKEFIRNVKDVSGNYKTLLSNPDFTEPFQKLIETAGLTDLAQEAGDAIAQYELESRELNLFTRNGDDTSSTATAAENLDARYKFEKELLVKKDAATKAERAMNRKISELNRALNANADVKAALSTLTAFDRRLTKCKSECAGKSQAAKLAIAIDDKDIRDRLNALIAVNLK